MKIEGVFPDYGTYTVGIYGIIKFCGCLFQTFKSHRCYYLSDCILSQWL